MNKIKRLLLKQMCGVALHSLSDTTLDPNSGHKLNPYEGLQFFSTQALTIRFQLPEEQEGVYLTFRDISQNFHKFFVPLHNVQVIEFFPELPVNPSKKK
jgi:hypothetical protein